MPAVFFDLDETLIHSVYPHIEIYPSWLISIEETGEMFNVSLRPGAKEVVEYARMLVGPQNVYLVSHGRNYYLREVNKDLELGFPSKNLLGREAWEEQMIGWGKATPIYEKASPTNILIDDRMIHHHHVIKKRHFLGIKDPKQFLQVRGYYAEEIAGYDFEEHVTKFLDERIK